MANKVIIEEYAAFDPEKQIPTKWLTTQVLDVAEKSAKLDAQTTYIRIRVKGVGVWYNMGDSTVSAVAETDDNSWIEPGDFVDHNVKGLYIDTAADV